MSLLSIDKSEVKYLSEEGLNEYERQLDKFGEALEKKAILETLCGTCPCPKGDKEIHAPHECDNCACCKTDEKFSQEEIKDIEMQHAD